MLDDRMNVLQGGWAFPYLLRVIALMSKLSLVTCQYDVIRSASKQEWTRLHCICIASTCTRYERVSGHASDMGHSEKGNDNRPDTACLARQNRNINFYPQMWLGTEMTLQPPDKLQEVLVRIAALMAVVA